MLVPDWPFPIVSNYTTGAFGIKPVWSVKGNISEKIQQQHTSPQPQTKKTIWDGRSGWANGREPNLRKRERYSSSPFDDLGTSYVFCGKYRSYWNWGRSAGTAWLPRKCRLREDETHLPIKSISVNTHEHCMLSVLCYRCDDSFDVRRKNNEELRLFLKWRLVYGKGGKIKYPTNASLPTILSTCGL